MALRKRKPTSPGRRFQTVSDFSEITKTDAREVAARRQAQHRWPQQLRPQDRPPQGWRPQAALPPDRLPSQQGRRARQGGRRSSTTPTATAASLLLHYLDGEKRYILAPQGRRGRRRAAERPGRRDPARQRPAACATSRSAPRCTTSSSSPAAAARWPVRAGTSVQLVAKEGDYATLRLPSTEMRRVPIDCRATVGEVGNAEAELIKIGKAGRNRWKGVTPQTRGVAMNPVDHPLGGGEGKTSGGRHPVSPWGKPEGRTRRQDQAVPEAHRPSSPHPRLAPVRSGVRDASFTQEGSVRRRPPAQEGRRPERRRREEGHQDLVPPFHDHPRHGRPHDRRARRPQARARCTSPSRWSVTSSASSLRPAPSSSTRAKSAT